MQSSSEFSPLLKNDCRDERDKARGGKIASRCTVFLKVTLPAKIIPAMRYCLQRESRLVASCLRFIGAVPETVNLTFKHPARTKARIFSSAQSDNCPRTPAIYFHRPASSYEAKEAEDIFPSRL